MKTKAQFAAEMHLHLSAARVIADKVKSEKRDFTDEETKTVEAHLGEIALLEKMSAELDPDGEKEKKNERNQAVMDQVLKLGENMDQGWQPGHSKNGSKPGPWSKAFLEQHNRSGRKELLTPSGSVGVPSLGSTIPAAAERLETIIQAFQPITPLTESSVEYLREVVRTQNAVAVAAGAKKPQSVYELVEVDEPAATIAHLTEPIKRQYLDDATNLRRYLDSVLRQGLQLGLENELVNGSGVAPHMTGMLQTAMINVLINPGGVSPILLARQGQTLLELQSLPVDGMVYAIHPTTWEEMETTRTIDGEFVMNLEGSNRGAPINRSLRTLWGSPVVPTVAVDENVLLLWHRSAVELFERQAATVDWSENVTELIDGSPVTDFERNMIRFRAEGRWVLACYRPSGIVEIVIAEGS